MDMVIASLTDDRGEEAKRWATFVITSTASIAASDAPRTANLEPTRLALKEQWYSWSIQGVNAACYGDATARRRNLVFAARRQDTGKVEPPTLGAPRPSSAANTVLLRHDRIAKDEWIGPEEGTFTLDPGVLALGEIMVDAFADIWSGQANEKTHMPCHHHCQRSDRPPEEVDRKSRRSSTTLEDQALE